MLNFRSPERRVSCRRLPKFLRRHSCSAGQPCFALVMIRCPFMADLKTLRMSKGSSISRTLVSITGSFPLTAGVQATGNGWRPECFVLYDRPCLMISLRRRHIRLPVVCIGKWSCIRQMCPSMSVICFSVRLTGGPLQKCGPMTEKQAQSNKT